MYKICHKQLARKTHIIAKKQSYLASNKIPQKTGKRKKNWHKGFRTEKMRKKKQLENRKNGKKTGNET